MENKKEALRGFYKSTILKELNALESKRKFIVFKMIFGITFPFVILTPLFVYLFLKYAQEPLYMLIPIAAVDIVGVMFTYAQFGETSFYKSFKKNVIKKLIKFINPALDYDNNLHVQIFEYNDSKFFPETEIEFFGDDHVAGQINGVDVEFSELEARYASPSDKKLYGKYQFKGLFFVANTFKKFPVSLVIRSRGVNDPEDEYFVSNGAFSAMFSVEILSGKEFAHKLLTEEFIAKMIEYKEYVPHDICFSIVDSKIFVAFSHDKDLFEPYVLKSLIDYDLITEYFNDLYYPLSIIEDLTKRQKNYQL
jgi:hypothetical protein